MMTHTFRPILLLFAATFFAACAAPAHNSPGPDWLIAPEHFPAAIQFEEEDGRIVLQNGLVSRTWLLKPNAVCVGLDDLMSGASLLRAVNPEARLTIDGIEHAIGGLIGQPNRAFLLERWQSELDLDPESWIYQGFEQGPIEERLQWPKVRHHAPDATWPPKGKHLALHFVPPAGALELAGVEAVVHYELYDGIPLFSKWIELKNKSTRTIEIDRVTTEELSIVENSNWVEAREGVSLPSPRSLHVETDYAFGGFVPENSMQQTVHWRTEPEFLSQVNYLRKTPCRLVVEPDWGPDVLLQPGQTFDGIRAFELLMDSSDRERRGLARRKMVRTLAPWVTENPLILHVVSSDPEVVRLAIDQAAECNFEMVSLSFGSGLSMENPSPENHAKFKALADYARSKNLHLGGYSLLSSRRIQPDGDNCINPETGEPGGQRFGYGPALASEWGQSYFKNLRAFFESTGFLQFTHDGSYPGDTDAAARPPLQRGLDDSQWVQWNIIADFYRWLRSRGVYLRIPDYYYYVGANECGMGYREVNWSLPRAEQVIHTRQNIYDGTWSKTPSMGWMFVPLTQYHGGGAAATIEPLDDHRDHYRRMLQSNLGLGVQAVYRGTRLFDSDATHDLVKDSVDWFIEHRDILESDIIHGRRADGRDLDWAVHVNPSLEECGMLVVFNPLEREVTKTLRVPLYYTGLEQTVSVSDANGESSLLSLARDFSIELEVKVPAGEMAWFGFSKP
ncbi:MAG: hypothetical protein ACI9F9_002928 [Candidatus Paceibacteria bacterium]|jgi:hypothetical protein